MRRGSPADLEAVLRIAGEAAEAPRWTEATFRALLTPDASEPQRWVLLAVGTEDALRGHVLGFAVVACVLDEAELESIVVEQASRRCGAGRDLCLALMKWAQGAGAQWMRLEVRAASVGAQALYRSLGFQAVGLRQRYYVDPTDDAVQMSVDLQAVDL